jgi:hypothetical protein
LRKPSAAGTRRKSAPQKALKTGHLRTFSDMIVKGNRVRGLLLSICSIQQSALSPELRQESRKVARQKSRGRFESLDPILARRYTRRIAFGIGF